MRLFRRRDETLNEQLLREAGYNAEGTYTGEVAHDERDAEPDQPELEPTDEGPQWDATVSVVDPDLEGGEYGFLVLADRSIIVDEDYDESQDLGRLASAVERELAPPYRAIAVRERGDVWDVFVNAVEIIDLPGFSGNEIELTWVDDEYTLTVDGHDRSDPPDALFALCDGDFELTASRIDDTLFEATVTPL